MAGTVVLYDVSISGTSPAHKGIEEITDASALENALKLFLMADKGDYLGQPNKGGYIVAKLMKPMRTVDALDLKTSIELGLSQYFTPTIETFDPAVTPDYANRRWIISFRYVCPSLKVAGTFKQMISGKV